MATAPDVLAGRLLLLADRLEADGTFGGKIAADEVREAAALLDGVARVEYGLEFVDPHPNDRVMMWTDSAWDRWPQNEDGPWAIPTINKHPVKVVKRTIVYGPWADCPAPDGTFVEQRRRTGDAIQHTLKDHRP